MTTCEHAFAIYLGGAETYHWRKMLGDGGATHAALNFLQLRKRTKAPPRDVDFLFKSSRIPELMVDAGGYSEAARKMNSEEAEDHVRAYQDWVVANLPHLTLAAEWDLGPLEAIEERRAKFWDPQVDPEVFLPIWHEEHGYSALQDLCRRYRHVGVAKPEGDMVGRLRAVEATTHVKLHGIGLTRLEDMTQAPYSSVSSTSWISPTRYGDVQVWAGGTFHWYPRGSSDQARRRHRLDFERAGFSAEDIAVGDNTEVSRYTVWAWTQYEADLAAKKARRGFGQIVALKPGVDTPPQDAAPPDAVEHPSYLPAARSEPKKPFPGLGSFMEKVQKPQVGGPSEVPVVAFGDSNLRRCDSCVLAGKCPAYTPGSECAYHMPIRIRTREQLVGSMLALLELQMDRIAFARMAEQADGIAADTTVSQLMTQYTEMMAKLKEVESDSSFLRIEVKGGGGGGILSQLLAGRIGPDEARKAGEEARHVVDPSAASSFLSDVLDVEPLEDDE